MYMYIKVILWFGVLGANKLCSSVGSYSYLFSKLLFKLYTSEFTESTFRLRLIDNPVDTV
jgi:hypothetical protein